MPFWHRIVIAAVVFALVWILARVVDWWLKRRGPLAPEAQTRYFVLRRAVTVTILVVGFLSALLVIPQVRAVAGGLLASSAVIGIVLGLASQQVLSNFMAGLVIASTQPVRIGDRVTYANEEGTIEEIGLTYTFIRTLDRRRLVVPNSKLASDTIINSSIRNRETVAEVRVPLPLQFDVSAAIEALRGEVASERDADVYVDSIDSAVNVVVCAVADDEVGADRLERDLRLRVHRRLRELGTGPTRPGGIATHLRGGAGRILAATAPLPAEQVDVAAASGRVLADDVRSVVDLPPFPSSAMDGYAVRAADLPGTLRDRRGVGGGRAVRRDARARRRSSDLDRRGRAGRRRRCRTRRDSCQTRQQRGDRSSARARGKRSTARRRRSHRRRRRVGRHAARACRARGDCRRWRRVGLVRAPAARGDPCHRQRARHAGRTARARADLRVEHTHACRRARGRGRGDRHRAGRSRRRSIAARGARAWSRMRRPRHVGRRLGRGARSRPRRSSGSSASKRCSGASRSSRASRSRSERAAQRSSSAYPGNPVSALVSAELFVKPALRALQGDPGHRCRASSRGGSAVDLRRNPERDEFVRARVAFRRRDAAVLEPLRGQESHMIASASAADALVHVPRGNGELTAGAVVSWLRLNAP